MVSCRATAFLAATSLAFPFSVQAAPPVGDTTGQVVFWDANGNGSFLGVGTDLGAGSYVLNTGETLSLTFGTDPDVETSRAKFFIGTTTGGGASDGTVALSNGSEVAMSGDTSGPIVVVGGGQFGGGPFSGTGTLSISSDATLSLIENGIASIDPASIPGPTPNISVGVYPGGEGAIELNDGNISLASGVFTQMTVGGAGGSGVLGASNGSTIQLSQEDRTGTTAIGSEFIIGSNGGDGEVTIDNSWLSIFAASGNGILVVGETAPSEPAGSGLLEVTGSSAWVEVFGGFAAVSVGRGSGAFGLVEVSNGGRMTIEGTAGGFSSLLIGSDAQGGTGVVNVTDGGDISVGGTSVGGEISVGAVGGTTGSLSSGSLTITGAGSQVSATVVDVGNKTGAGTTNGSVVVSTGGTLISPTINIWEGGSLSGSGGTVVGDVYVNAGGALAPGLSPGTLTVDGDLTLNSGSTFEIELGGTDPGQYDVVEVFGDVIVAGAFNLIVSMVSGYVPEEGSSWDFLSMLGGGTVDPDFFSLAAVTVQGLGAGSAFSLSGSSSGGLTLTADTVSAIPLPPAGLMLLAGLAALGFARRQTCSASTWRM